MTHHCTADCTAGWSASRRCHCSACGENFTTPANFDKHRGWDRAKLLDWCNKPRIAGLVQNARGDWMKPPREVDTARNTATFEASGYSNHG